MHTFIAGFLAGLFSKFATHPLDVIKKRYQTAGLMRHPRYGKTIEEKYLSSVITCTASVVKEEGLTALWKGCLPNLIKVGSHT